MKFNENIFGKMTCGKTKGVVEPYITPTGTLNRK